MKEVWRAVVDYEGYYEVSNFGRVKSYPRKTPAGMRGGRILKPAKSKGGYLFVGLHKDGKQENCLIHRLVAQAFLPNPQNLPIVNHKDENKENNFVFIQEDGSVDFTKSNLEWCDYKYSVDYGTRNERAAKALSKPVAQKTKDGELIKIWSSLNEIQRQTGWHIGNISRCCNGERKQAHGSLWSYMKKAEYI